MEKEPDKNQKEAYLNCLYTTSMSPEHYRVIFQENDPEITFITKKENIIPLEPEDKKCFKKGLVRVLFYEKTEEGIALKVFDDMSEEERFIEVTGEINERCINYSDEVR